MKPAVQLAASALAVCALVAGVASHATNLSELPLKPSVLAKPNVMFGMDDSGSMDFEVMLYGSDGAFWWDFIARTGWGVDPTHPNTSLRTVVSPWFNGQGDVTNQWRKMAYLFPNGSGVGNRLLTDGSSHFAIMPTTEFAFTRWSGISKAAGIFSAAPTAPASSSMHNPLYYNPLITYQPWATARVGTMAANLTPVPAIPTAARSHPLNSQAGTSFSGGSGALNLSGPVAANQADDWVFTAFPGMTVPAGVNVRVCNSSNGGCVAWANNAVQLAVPANQVWRVAMAYRPATVWVKEACTVPNSVNVATDSCAALPGGGTLRRYDISSATASYNWGSFSRSGVEELQNFANWWQYYRKRKLMLNAAMGETMEEITGLRMGVVPFNNRQASVTLFDADSTNPDNNRLRVAGLFYNDNGSGGTPTRETLDHIGRQYSRTDGPATGRFNVVQFACQRNAAFIVTDGFANASGSQTLAQMGSTFWINNPRPDLALGKVPATALDDNTNLHMNTYGLTMGARGTLFLSETSIPPVNAGDWPVPNQNRNPTSVDDLWRATINGKGRMYLATTPEETADRIRTGLDDIVNQQGAQGGVAVSAVNLDQGDGRAYLGKYNPRGWTGDLTANAIDRATAEITLAPTWQAASLLAARPWNTRIIFTSGGPSGVDFTDASVPGSAAVVSYLRGNRTGEGDTLRARRSLIGPVVNAEPVLAREERMVYLASGDGMLHAFDTLTGVEQWAYAPPDMLPGLVQSAQRGWAYQTLLDATPTYARLTTGRKLLVGGLGAAGRSYYALDVTTPRGITAAQAQDQFKWIFPAANDAATRAKVGFTTGKPVIARTTINGAVVNVVLVTSGYNNGQNINDGIGRLWMLNANDGTVMKTFRTTAGAPGAAEAGLSAVSAFKDADGTVRFVYGGDVLGNLWRFDLAAAGAGDIDGELLATLRDAAGNAQPVTAAPELVTVMGRRVVLIGTGRLLDVTDFGSGLTQSFYAIAEGASLVNARNSLVPQTFSRATDSLTGDAVNWDIHRGWYFDLPAGEQANTDPTVAYGGVAFVTNASGGSNCAQSSFMYLVDVSTGKRVLNSTFVSQTISLNDNASRVVVVLAQNGPFGLIHKSNGEIFRPVLPPNVVINPAKNAWKEIRR